MGQRTGGGTFRNVSVTALENFGLTGERLAVLEMARGKQLFATRFDGKKAYVVAFEQVDPLWLIDLSHPSLPTTTGHLAVS